MSSHAYTPLPTHTLYVLLHVPANRRPSSFRWVYQRPYASLASVWSRQQCYLDKIYSAGREMANVFYVERERRARLEGLGYISVPYAFVCVFFLSELSYSFTCLLNGLVWFGTIRVKIWSQLLLVLYVIHVML